MAIRACLAKISPLDPATGNRVDVYLSSVNDRIMAPIVNGLGGFTWTPALKAAPLLTMQLWNGDFQAAVDPGQALIPLKMEAIKRTIAAADTYFWVGAPVEIYAEVPGVAWPWSARFKGTVETLARQAQDLALTASVGSSEHDKDVLTTSYAGTGGAEGGADLKNKLKPLVLGWAKNVEPVLVDAVNNVHQFSGYGAIEAVTTLFERGSAFTAAIADYASYAALIAATIPPGRWGTCLAQGMIRLGAPAYGLITADLKGHKVGSTTPRLTGAVINALATIAGVSSGVINAASLTAMDTAVPYSINLVVRDQASWLETAQRLALACNYQAGLSLIGSFFVAGVSLAGTEIITLDAQGKALPQVTGSDEQDVSVPYYKTLMGAARAWRVHSADEIATNAELIDKGAYDAATTYREGNFVTSPDGSQWLYTITLPTAGNAPPTWPATSNTWWSIMAAPLNVSDLGYLGDLYATRNDDGENFIHNPQLTTDTNDWLLSVGVFRQSITGFPIAAWFQFPAAVDRLAVANNNQFIALNGATSLFISCWRYIGGVGAFLAGMDFYTAAGVYISTFTIDLYTGGGPAFTQVKGTTAVPSNAAYFKSYFKCNLTSGVANGGGLRVSRVESGATYGAPIGAPVGTITAGDVSTTINSGGGVAANNVVTSSITNAAVNAVSNAYTAGNATFGAGVYTTIQSVSLNTSGAAGSVVAIKACANLSLNDQAYLAAALRITRDGAVIFDATLPQTYTSVAGSPGYNVFFCSFLGTISISDTPGAGAHTYELQLFSSIASGSPTNPTASNRYLEAIEIKK